jgi:hypothetical protein
MSLEQLVSHEPIEAPTSDGRPFPSRARVPDRIEFAVNLKAYIDKMGGACPLCGYRDHEESSIYEKETE